MYLSVADARDRWSRSVAVRGTVLDPGRGGTVIRPDIELRFDPQDPDWVAVATVDPRGTLLFTGVWTVCLVVFGVAQMIIRLVP